MTYNDGGPWTPEEHAQSRTFDHGLADAIATVIGEQRVRVSDIIGGPGLSAIDWGCGFGYYLRHLRSVIPGLMTLGVEPIPMGDDFEGGVQALADMGAYPVHLGRHQIALCLEVAEHLPRDTHRQAFDNIANSITPGGLLFFSGATPGQGGNGHVAERPEWEWIEELGSRGLRRMERSTEFLRDSASLIWFKNNAAVFKA